MSSIFALWCNVIHCKSGYKKLIPLFSVFLACLSMFVMSHFLGKKIADLKDILCYLVEFCILSEIHASKILFKQINENVTLKVYARMFFEPVYKISYP